MRYKTILTRMKNRVTISFTHNDVIYELTLKSELTDISMQALIFQTLDAMRSAGVVIREVPVNPLNPTKQEVEIDVVKKHLKKEKHTDEQRAYFSSVWERIKKEL